MPLMPLPAWMDGYPGAPKPAVPPTHPAWMAGHLDTPTAPAAEPADITPCTCRGEGCTACDDDGVIYP